MTIRELTAPDIAPSMDALIELLQDTVDSGASVGFLPPVLIEDARAFWDETAVEIDGGGRVVLAAFDEDDLVGVVHLVLCTRANGLHRAEVAKLMVHRKARRRGIGRALMLAVEDLAKKHHRTLLVLDTRRGDISEQLYKGMAYQVAGTIPNYALSANGELHETVLFYKNL